MKRVIDHLYVIFPFEVAFFASYGMPSVFVGNPTARAVSEYLKAEPRPMFEQKTIALLPGSRPAEVKQLLPQFIRAVQQTETTDVKILVAAAPSLSQEFYENVLQESQLQAELCFGKTFDILYTAAQTGGYAMVASGTATLETALMGCRQLVAYKVSPITFFIGKNLFGIRHVSLVNILLKRAAVQELLQDVSVTRLKKGIEHLNYDAVALQAELEGALGVGK